MHPDASARPSGVAGACGSLGGAGAAMREACEWRTGCMGWQAPCFGIELLAPCTASVMRELLLLRAAGSCFGCLFGTIPLAILVPPLGLRGPEEDVAAPPVSRSIRTRRRAVVPEHGVWLDASDAEDCAGVGSSTLLCPSPSLRKTAVRRCELATPVSGASCGAGVPEECYLVDPASSHMLVSKIKPCMCKYEQIQTVKLRMAH